MYFKTMISVDSLGDLKLRFAGATMTDLEKIKNMFLIVFRVCVVV